MVSVPGKLEKYPVKRDFEYKQELALQLIKRFGIAEARHTCIQNNWEEVLQAVNLVKTNH